MTRLQNILKYLPGILACALVMIAAIYVAEWIGVLIHTLQGIEPTGTSPVSSILVAILIGLLIRNIFDLHPRLKPGVSFSMKTILKIGIILLGIRLSFFDVLVLGMWAIPIIVACIAAGVIVTIWAAKKLELTKRLGTLTAVGTSICGVTAIMGTAPGIKAKEQEISYAVATITLFGVFCMFVYPHLAFALFADDSVRAGLFLGTAIHDTAQVVGSSLIYEEMYQDQTVVDVATITKLTRNSFLVLMVPILTYYFYRSTRGTGEAQEGKKWHQLIPLFVIGFILMASVRTIGDAGIENQAGAFGLWSGEQWESIWRTTSSIGTTYLLSMAMAAVGLSTNLRALKNLGVKPFFIGTIAAFTVSVVSLIMVYLLGGFIDY